MKFKKIISAFMAVAIMTTMVACGKTDETQQEGQKENSKLTLRHSDSKQWVSFF